MSINMHVGVCMCVCANTFGFRRYLFSMAVCPAGMLCLHLTFLCVCVLMVPYTLLWKFPFTFPPVYTITLENSNTQQGPTILLHTQRKSVGVVYANTNEPTVTHFCLFFFFTSKANTHNSHMIT